MLISFFRYSGLVYHVAILSEAIYLMMLLKFPYYSESKGCKFCILTTWSKYKKIWHFFLKTVIYLIINSSPSDSLSNSLDVCQDFRRKSLVLASVKYMESSHWRAIYHFFSHSSCLHSNHYSNFVLEANGRKNERRKAKEI